MAATAMQAQLMEGLDEGDLPRVKLGDASIAAPFTSKMPSIAAAVDIVRQARRALQRTPSCMRRARARRLPHPTTRTGRALVLARRGYVPTECLRMLVCVGGRGAR